MTDAFSDATVASTKYYLDRIRHILNLLSERSDAEALLVNRLAPDMLDTGLHFAISIKFAARALCPPLGLEIPEIPEIRSCENLDSYAGEIAALIAPIEAHELSNGISHIAGKAEITQEPADYILRFAQPNMIFHLSMAYAGLRHAGMSIGKADFDGLHVY